MAEIPPATDVVIVGAGIIGLACAWHLLAAGRRVRLIDSRGLALGASHGNAGALAFSNILPLATGSVWRGLPRWLGDPLGPFSVPPSYLPRIAPWLLRLWRASRPDRAAATIAAKIALMRLARDETAALALAAGLTRHIRHDGALELYESELEFAATLPGWAARDRAGILFEHVRGTRLAELQPGLAPGIVAGTFVPGWESVDDPYLYASALGEAVLRRGAEFERAEIAAVAPAGDGATVDLVGGGTRVGRHVVIAAGAWSKPLAVMLGDRIPLETERGYNTTLPPGAFDIRRQLVFGGHGLVVGVLSTGIRIGGGVEFGGLALPPNFARATAMLEKARTLLPGLATEGGTPWMGFRPSLPDSLPVIGRSRRTAAVIYAFGHGHHGLAQSAATGRLVAELVAGRPPAIDPKPFSPQRF